MNQILQLPLLDKAGVQLAVKREDLLHPVISGNKFRKLKYNLEEARKNGHDALLTFGGAFSNHVLAVACAGKENGFRTIGIIRGEELEGKWESNPTLQAARAYGMEFSFVNREDYRNRYDPKWQADLASAYGGAYVIPEGGSNMLGVKGCREILQKGDGSFDIIACAVGTGATLAGLAESCLPHQQIFGVAALKGEFLEGDIRNFTSRENWTLETAYHFGGYAKSPERLIDFVNAFKKNTGIQLDPIYTGKLFFGIFDWISKGKFPKGSAILVIHTGGLQGIRGFNLRQKERRKTQIEV